MKPIPTWQQCAAEIQRGKTYVPEILMQQEIDALRTRCAELERDAEKVFDVGFRLAATWANRYDLFPDVDSPEYKEERATLLAAMAAVPKGE